MAAIVFPAGVSFWLSPYTSRSALFFSIIGTILLWRASCLVMLFELLILAPYVMESAIDLSGASSSRICLSSSSLSKVISVSTDFPWAKLVIRFLPWPPTSTISFSGVFSNERWSNYVIGVNSRMCAWSPFIIFCPSLLINWTSARGCSSHKIAGLTSAISSV